jgi:hypothetical protein
VPLGKAGNSLVTLLEETAVISAVSAILVTIFAVIQLRHLEKHRNVEISMKLFEWAETDRLRKALKWLDKEYMFTTAAEYKAFEAKHPEAADYPQEITAFFEQVGFLVEKKFVDLDVVADRLGHYVVHDWRKLEPWIVVNRKERNDSTYGEHFQHLYQHTVSYMQKRCTKGETNFCTELTNHS